MNIRGPVQTFLDIFQAASVLVDEASIEKTADSLNFRGMDPSHIAMLDISYPNTEFETFEGEIKLGVRTDEITKILKRFDKKASVSLSVADSMLILSDGQRVFRNRLIKATAGDVPMPKLKLEVKAELDRDYLKNILKDVQVISEFIQLRAEGEGDTYSFEAWGRGDSDECAISIDTEANGQGEATYSLDYIIKMVDAVSSEKVTLEYASKMPLKLTMGYIAYYLAPRVQD